MGRGEKMSEFIQVGVTALRDPLTGEFLPSVPLYVERTDLEAGPVPKIDLFDIGTVLAGKMREYLNGCKKEGVKI